jgi:2-oxo-3-(phosphooxy)propyl 3-oxoalkanoate synthase
MTSISVGSSTFTAESTSTSGQLSFAAGVSRNLVHRLALSEVLLTDWGDLGNGHAICAAQWPGGHRLYRAHDGVHDSMLVAETLRQTGILVAHTLLNVPEDHRLIMDRPGWPPDRVRST